MVLRFWHAPVSLGRLLKTMFKHTKAAIFLWIWKKSSAFMLLKSDCGKCSLCLSLSSQSWPFVSVCSFQFSAITHSNSQQQDLHQLPCCDPAYHCKELGCSRDKYVPGNPRPPPRYLLYAGIQLNKFETEQSRECLFFVTRNMHWEDHFSAILEGQTWLSFASWRLQCLFTPSPSYWLPLT